MCLLRSAAGFAAILAATLLVDVRASEDEQLWLQTLAQGPVAGEVVYFAELQSRFGSGASDLSQILIRPAIGLRLSPSVSVYQGYAHVRTPLAAGGDTEEDRSFQQVNWQLGKPGGVGLSSRTRLEQRWLSNGDDTGWRLRQMVRAAAPLKPEGGAALLGWAEVFVALNDTDWGAREGFDRLRTFGGVELPLSGRSTIEAGYLNQYVRRPGRADHVDHVLIVSLMLRH